MERIDEIIWAFDNAQCPKNYKECPLYPHNDCDNYCPFTEASNMLKDYKRLLESAKEMDKYCKQACSDCNLTLEECRNLI